VQLTNAATLIRRFHEATAGSTLAGRADRLSQRPGPTQHRSSSMSSQVVFDDWETRRHPRKKAHWVAGVTGTQRARVVGSSAAWERREFADTAKRPIVRHVKVRGNGVCGVDCSSRQSTTSWKRITRFHAQAVVPTCPATDNYSMVIATMKRQPKTRLRLEFSLASSWAQLQASTSACG
jgi:hypothetical protein